MKNAVKVFASLALTVAIYHGTDNSVLVESGSAGVELAGFTYVQPYTRGNGTSVGGYLRTTPDSSPYNNFSCCR